MAAATGAGQPLALFDNRWYPRQIDQRSQRGPARRAAGEGLCQNGAEPLTANVSPKDYAPSIDQVFRVIFY